MSNYTYRAPKDINITGLVKKNALKNKPAPFEHQNSATEIPESKIVSSVLFQLYVYDGRASFRFNIIKKQLQSVS